MEALLNRLPEKIKAEHYHDDEAHIHALLEANALVPNVLPRYKSGK